MRVLSPTAILGYGFPESSFAAGLDEKPDLIAVDAGSTDPGPFYLGEGISFTDRASVQRDMSLILEAGSTLGIPITVGSAGGCGGDSHLDWCLDIIRGICTCDNRRLKVCKISSEIGAAQVLDKLRAGDIVPLGPSNRVPGLSEDVVYEATRIVAQIGVEPFMEALSCGADLVVAGRAYDPAVFACLPMLKGCDAGLSLHMGKILECAAIAATPGSGSDCMLGDVDVDSFVVYPMAQDRKCTVSSVAAHTLYEKSNPYILPGPGGYLDLHGSRFSQESAKAVRVKGSRHIAGDELWVKLEGARRVGYRTTSIAGARDPVFISCIDDVLEGVKNRTRDNFRDARMGQDYHLRFVVYGKNGIMGDLEPMMNAEVHEVGIIIDSVASTQDLASTICSFARSTLLHYGYPGRKSTAGNLALLFSPSDIKMGPVYEFCIHHLMRIDDYSQLVNISWEEMGP